jgi:hypothetical protein
LFITVVISELDKVMAISSAKITRVVLMDYGKFAVYYIVYCRKSKKLYYLETPGFKVRVLEKFYLHILLQMYDLLGMI